MKMNKEIKKEIERTINKAEKYDNFKFLLITGVIWLMGFNLICYYPFFEQSYYDIKSTFFEPKIDFNSSNFVMNKDLIGRTESFSLVKIDFDGNDTSGNLTIYINLEYCEEINKSVELNKSVWRCIEDGK